VLHGRRLSLVRLPVAIQTHVPRCHSIALFVRTWPVLVLYGLQLVLSSGQRCWCCCRSCARRWQWRTATAALRTRRWCEPARLRCTCRLLYSDRRTYVRELAVVEPVLNSVVRYLIDVLHERLVLA